MLTLTLMRHAKASPQGYGDDFKRPLADRGKVDAAKIGAHLAGLLMVPQVALVSAAVRTTQTFEIVEAQFGRKIAARFERGLYNATPGQIRDALKRIDASIQHLMIVGHNPGMMEAAILFARDGDILELERLRSRFPPGAVAVLGFNTTDWLDARAAGGKLDLLLLPEDLDVPSDEGRRG